MKNVVLVALAALTLSACGAHSQGVSQADYSNRYVNIGYIDVSTHADRPEGKAGLQCIMYNQSNDRKFVVGGGRSNCPHVIDVDFDNLTKDEIMANDTLRTAWLPEGAELAGDSRSIAGGYVIRSSGTLGNSLRVTVNK
jgi:hypothetical protein